MFAIGVIGSELGYQTDFPFGQATGVFNTGATITGGPLGNGGALIYPFWTEAGAPQGTEMEWAVPRDVVVNGSPAFPNNSFDFVIYATNGLGDITQRISYTLAAPPAGVPGDYNDDDKVDAADYVVWRKTRTRRPRCPTIRMVEPSARVNSIRGGRISARWSAAGAWSSLRCLEPATRLLVDAGGSVHSASAPLALSINAAASCSLTCSRSERGTQSGKRLIDNLSRFTRRERPFIACRACERLFAVVAVTVAIVPARGTSGRTGNRRAGLFLSLGRQRLERPQRRGRRSSASPPS